MYTIGNNVIFLLIVAVTTTSRLSRKEDNVFGNIWGQNFFSRHIFHYIIKLFCFFFPFPFPFPSIPKSESLWLPFPNYGNGFFHSPPVPEIWECPFSFPSHSRILGMLLLHSLPVPEFWEWVFYPPLSRADTLGPYFRPYSTNTCLLLIMCHKPSPPPFNMQCPNTGGTIHKRVSLKEVATI